MPHTPETSQTLQDQLLDIQDEAKKNKVELIPEVQAYIREHLVAVQQKLVNREDVTEDDLKFIQDVRLWVSLPEDLRLKYNNASEAKNSKEAQMIISQAENLHVPLHEAGAEGKKRGINTKQWLDLLHVAEAAKKDKKWIDETFIFPGSGRIETERDLEIYGLKSLTHLPSGLHVGGDLDLSGCTSLTELPSGLHVGALLILSDCTSLTSLPEGLEVARDLILSSNLHEQVKKDAERLKNEGKIKDEIICE